MTETSNVTELFEIPDNFIGFAEAIASAAQAHGIDTCTVSFRPDIEQRLGNQSWGGDVRIIYRATDGRGRPDRCLTMEMEMRCRLQMVNHGRAIDASN